jgi:hypothetical protein
VFRKAMVYDGHTAAFANGGFMVHVETRSGFGWQAELAGKHRALLFCQHAVSPVISSTAQNGCKRHGETVSSRTINSQVIEKYE